MNHRLLIAAAALVGLSVMELASGGPHLYYDDAGNVNWRSTYAAAVGAAQKSGRLVFAHVSKPRDQPSDDQIAKVFREPRIGQILNRYYVAVSIDFDKPPPELKPHVDKLAKQGTPFMLVVNTQGKLLHSLDGVYSPQTMEKSLLRILDDQKYVVPKAKEAEISKQIDAMEKGAGQKKWSTAVGIFKSIQAVPGYSPVKDKAYDTMDKAQADGIQDTKDAFNHVRQDEYAEAKKSLDKAIKSNVGLPIADEPREHLAAVKILEQADQLSKGSKKAEALKQFDVVLTKHSDTPYAALAKQRKNELAPAKDK